MSEKLLPCPFCGGDAAIVSPLGAGNIRAVECRNTECASTGPWGKNEAEAIAAWNTRPSMQVDAAPDALAVINRIAEVSSAFACQAGVGGMETAGSIISFLATNPQRIHDFMSGGSIIDWPISWQRAGCLSWQGMDGKIHWPGEGNIQ